MSNDFLNQNHQQETFGATELLSNRDLTSLAVKVGERDYEKLTPREQRILEWSVARLSPEAYAALSLSLN